VDSVVSDLPKGFPERVADSIQQGFRQRLKLFDEPRGEQLPRALIEPTNH
jgi:hypothetical protein